MNLKILAHNGSIKLKGVFQGTFSWWRCLVPYRGGARTEWWWTRVAPVPFHFDNLSESLRCQWGDVWVGIGNCFHRMIYIYIYTLYIIYLYLYIYIFTVLYTDTWYDFVNWNFMIQQKWMESKGMLPFHWISFNSFWFRKVLWTSNYLYCVGMISTHTCSWTSLPWSLAQEKMNTSGRLVPSFAFSGWCEPIWMARNGGL